jgi:surfeit locus 1 family protein
MMAADASRTSRAILLVLVAAAFAVLIALGTWQVNRLQWKEALIATIEARVASPERPLADIEALWAEERDVEYVPVTVSGRFDHAREQHFLATFQGQSGWYVYTPLALADGRTVIVNRGFVPYDRKDPASRDWSEPAGVLSLTGLARNPLSEKPGFVVPDNAPESNVWYWKDFEAMRMAMGLRDTALVPFFVDVVNSGTSAAWPAPGVTQVSLPNNHLQYAITWYGLAAALAGVAGFMFFRRPETPIEDSDIKADTST